MTMIWLNMIMQDQILSLAEYGVFSFYRPSYETRLGTGYQNSAVATFILRHLHI